MLAIMIHASALSMVASKSLARRRLRPSQAKVRSAPHRRGSSWKPFAVSARLTISSDHVPSLASAASSLGPA